MSVYIDEKHRSQSYIVIVSASALIILKYTVQRSAQLHDKAMRRRAHGHSDGTNSCDRIINFSSRSVSLTSPPEFDSLQFHLIFHEHTNVLPFFFYPDMINICMLYT